MDQPNSNHSQARGLLAIGYPWRSGNINENCYKSCYNDPKSYKFKYNNDKCPDKLLICGREFSAATLDFP